MICKLLDLACHAQSALWEWWAGVGFINKGLIIFGLVALIAGALKGFLSILHKIGGWPAVVGALVLILGVVLAILPRKPKGSDAHETLPDDHVDTKGPFQFGVDKKRVRPKVAVPKKRPKGETAADRWEQSQ